MNLLQQFVDFLKNRKNQPSFLTVKNYKADIGQFISWFEKEFNFSFNPSIITLQILEHYKKSRNLSPSSIERHISSLRKFFNFLKFEGIISHSPLQNKTASAQALKDPWKLRNFKNFLYEYKKSHLTIKNYINDIKSFFLWLNEVSLTKYVWNITDRNLLSKVNFSVLDEYKQRLITSNFSPRTVNRKLSSLRNYINWAKNQGLISSGQVSMSSRTCSPRCLPRQDKAGEAGFGISGNGEKMLKQDGYQTVTRQVQHDTGETAYSSFPPIRLMQKSLKGANLLFDNLFILPLAQTIDNLQYLFWKVSGKKVFKKGAILSGAKNLRSFGFQPRAAGIASGDARQDDIARIPNIQKGFYAPLKISMRYLPKHKRVWHHLRHVRPNWYKKYHSYSIAHYFHFAILIILASAIGFGTYNAFFADTQKGKGILGAFTSGPPRILSFQGRLTDSSNNPITTATNILFSIYNDQSTSGDAFLWQETNPVKPDSDGIFSVLLGKNTPIPDTLFSQNPELFLGITIGNGPELRPRQQLATVRFASNAETLQGLEPITNTAKVSNVVLALDSSGNLSIAGSKAHTFQAIGGQFIISGSILSLTTVPGSNSRVEIVPDGMGKIDLSKPIQNSTNNNNLSSAIGAVEFDDMVAILATSSAQSAFTINQNSTGPLISASTLGTAKFTVDNDGTGIFAGSVGINGSSLISTATTFNLLDSNVKTLNLALEATSLFIGSGSGTLTLRNANTSIQGNVTLGDAATDTITFTSRVAQDSDLIPIGTAGTNDLGSSSLPWDNAYIDNIYSASTGTFGHWQRANGAVIPTNITDDLLLGATSTSSAKFAFINVGGGNPTATISSNLSLVVPTGNAPANTFNLLNNGSLNIQRSPGGDAGLTTALYIGNNGNVGIGTATPRFRLDLQDSQSATAAAQIFNSNTSTDADALVLKLGNTSTSAVASSNHFISFETAGIGIVGSVQGNGGKGVTYATSGIADFAEYFKKDKGTIIEYGSLVCLNEQGLSVKCDTSNSNNTKVIGIASERPAFLGGENLGDGSIAVGLVGQVETFVSNANGEIKAGDPLTASDIPGVAAKATKAGQVVGKALEDLSIINESKIVGFYDPQSKEYRSKDNFPDIAIKPNIIRIFKLLVLVNVSWHDPSAYLANTGELIINSTGKNSYSVSSPLGQTLTNIGAFFEVVAANIKTGFIKASEVTTNSLIVTSDSVIIGGQNLKDYIVAVVDELGIRNQESSIISPVVKTNQLFTNIISPLAQDSNISISLHDSQFIIHDSRDASGSAVATIDNQGNASFSGQLQTNELLTNQLTTNDASISGILRARNIIADSIQGFIDIASFSAALTYVPNLQAEQGLFNQGLMVFGSTSLSDLSIVGQLSIGGTMFVTDNSIETLGTNLSLQSLRQGGLSIMGGLVYVDTDGNLKVKGNVSIFGQLAVNIISPLPTSDLVVNNASGSSVLSINQKGDIVASGSGTFSKLNFSLIQPALAVSATEVIASSSAGAAKISSYQTEVTIRNALVTDKSVIYITPVGTPSAQSPFLMRQLPNEPALSGIEGSFTVGVESPNKNPIPFNWLIVN